VTTTVRVAGRADGPAVAALRRAWVEEQAGGPVHDPAFEPGFDAWWRREHDQRVTWLAEADGRAVGMLNLLVFTRMPKPQPAGSTWASQWGYVANVYVELALRDGGVGRALLDAATAYADERGFARLVLSPSPRSVPFYERAGFLPATSLMVRERH
jgi:GNAT superfamily N-acetyltransferase